MLGRRRARTRAPRGTSRSGVQTTRGTGIKVTERRTEQRATTQPTTERDRARLAVAALTAFAFALRVAFLDRQSLWVDEALSVVFADRPLAELFETLITADIHPPLYPLFLHYWFKLAGTSEAAVRFPSVVFGTLLVPSVYALAHALAAPDRRLGHWWGLAAAALVAVSPYMVYFSQEARNYSAVTLWVTLAMVSLWRALQRGGPRWWIGYGVATLAALYTHYNAFLMLAAPPLVLLVARERFAWAVRPWLATMTVVSLAYLPWAAFAVAQVTRIDDFWPGTIGLLTVVERTWLAFSSGDRGILAIPAAALAGGLFVLGLRTLPYRRAGDEPAALLFLVAHLIIPLLALYALIAVRPKFNARYLIVIAPLFYLVLARGLLALSAPGATWARWRTRVQRTVAAGLVSALLLLSAAGIRAVYVDPAYAKEDYRGLVAYITQHWQAGDVVVLIMDAYQPIAYYGGGKLAYAGLQPYDDQQAAVERLNEIAASYRRIWLVLWQADWADPARFARHLIEEAGRELPVTAQFHGLGLRLFELPQGTRFSVEPRIAHPAAQRFGDALLFLGWNAPSEAPAGGQARYDLHWQALAPPAEDPTTTLAVRDRAGRVVAKSDCATGHWTYPPPRWRIGPIVHSQCDIRLPGYLEPGDYAVDANLWDRRRAAPIARRDAQGQVLAPQQPLGTLHVALPAAGVASTMVARRVDAVLAVDGQEVLRLHGSEMQPATVRAGDVLRVVLFWEAGAIRPPRDYGLEVRLGSRPLARLPSPTGEEPTTAWPPGAWRVGELAVHVPADLAPGEHTLSVALLDGRAGHMLPLRNADRTESAQSIALGQVRVVPR